MLADRQAELLSEIRQLSQGITVGRLAPPGTPTKETTQERAKRTQSAPPTSKSIEPSSKEKSRQQRDSFEKEMLPDVEKLKHRSPYTKKEEQEMINYFLKYGGFLCKGGNIVWQRMEASKCVPGRSWQSLKERFNKYTCKKLHMFGVKKRDLIEGGSDVEKRAPVVALIPAPTKPVNSPPRKRKRGPPYTVEEEMSMVKYFLDNLGRYAQRRGNLVWKEMEASRICPGRSWASLKQRFCLFVQNNLEQFGVFEGAFMGVAELQLTKDLPHDTADGDPKSTKAGENDSTRVEDRSESKFRKPYSAKEEKEVVDYLLANGGFGRVGGNELWKEMEEKGVCKGRSWQSLKARYVKAISGRLEDFGTTREALQDADMKLQKKKKAKPQENNFMDDGETVPDSEDGTTSQKESVPDNCEPERSSEVDTQKLIDTIFGDERELDIEVAEMEDEMNASVAAEFHVEHNDEGEPSELDLLAVEMNANNQTNPSVTDEPKRSEEEKDDFDLDSDSDSDTLMDRIMAKSKRGGAGGKRGKRRKEAEVETEEEARSSIKERLKVEKKRKAETQEIQDSPPKKRMRVS